MISFRSKKFKEKFKAFTSENTELKKPNEDLKKKKDPNSRRESKPG